jgi:hypothetical protein
MAGTVMSRIPVVAGEAYGERVRPLSGTFTARLQPERENRYFPSAIAVLVNDAKVGYVAPEVARQYFEPLLAWSGDPVTCPGRCALVTDRESSGVLVLLDFSNLPVAPAE